MLFAALDCTDFIWIAVIVSIFAGSSAAVARLRTADQRRLRRLEQKLDLLLRHFGIEVPDPATAAGLSPEAKQLADEGKKIEAIKAHREQTGLGLKDAKDDVEGYMDK
jgi:hypothetical protein